MDGWMIRVIGRLFVSPTGLLKEDGSDCGNNEGQKHIDLSRSWTGRGHAVVRKFDEAGAAVHRVKVDEVDRTIITTSGRGKCCPTLYSLD
jgi:hypothetical protein